MTSNAPTTLLPIIEAKLRVVLDEELPGDQEAIDQHRNWLASPASAAYRAEHARRAAQARREIEAEIDSRHRADEAARAAARAAEKAARAAPVVEAAKKLTSGVPPGAVLYADAIRAALPKCSDADWTAALKALGWRRGRLAKENAACRRFWVAPGVPPPPPRHPEPGR